MTRPLLLALALAGCASPEWVLARTAPNESASWCLYGEIAEPYRVTLGSEPTDATGSWSWAVAPPGGTLFAWAPGEYELGGFWTPAYYDDPPWIGIEYVHEGCGLSGVEP